MATGVCPRRNCGADSAPLDPLALFGGRTQGERCGKKEKQKGKEERYTLALDPKLKILTTWLLNRIGQICFLVLRP